MIQNTKFGQNETRGDGAAIHLTVEATPSTNRIQSMVQTWTSTTGTTFERGEDRTKAKQALI